ncbi:MAG: hypothetical protein AAGG38_13490 [Planctomycetota bacterium]
MAVTTEEKFGRRLADDSAELVYLIRGASNANEARTALLVAAPDTSDGLNLDDAEVEELDGLAGTYTGFVRYVGGNTAAGTSLPSFRFETRGATQRIFQSLQTVSSHHSADVPGAPNFGGAINVAEQAVEGTDVTVPIYTFSETHAFTNAQVTNTFKANLFALTGTVNSSSFRGLNAGEALFLGAAGSQQGDGDWAIDFAFAGSPNLTGITVGDMTGIAKKGWEYLWVRYQTAEDTDAKLLVRKPVAAYVERVYHSGDFSLLGI